MAKKARKARKSRRKVARKTRAPKVKVISTRGLADASKALRLAARNLAAVDKAINKTCRKRRLKVLV